MNFPFVGGKEVNFSYFELFDASESELIYVFSLKWRGFMAFCISWWFLRRLMACVALDSPVVERVLVARAIIGFSICYHLNGPTYIL